MFPIEMVASEQDCLRNQPFSIEYISDSVIFAVIDSRIFNNELHVSVSALTG